MQKISSSIYPCDSIRAVNEKKALIGMVIESPDAALLEKEIPKIKANLDEFKCSHPLDVGHDVYVTQSSGGIYFIVYEAPGTDAARFQSRANSASAALGAAKAASIDYFSMDEGLCTSSALAKHLFGMNQESRNSQRDPVDVIEQLNDVLLTRTESPATANFSPALRQSGTQGQDFATRLGVDRKACSSGWVDRSRKSPLSDQGIH